MSLPSVPDGNDGNAEAVDDRSIIANVVNARGRAGRSRTHGIPPMRCTATSKYTGEQCKKWAVPGTTVCHMHGVTSNGARKAEERVTLAQLLEGDPRHPWQVVLDATHTLDAIMRDHRAEVLAGETVTVDQLDRMIGYTQAAHHMATVAINTKAAEKMTVAVTQHLELQGRLVGLAIDAVVSGLTASLDTASGEQLHDWALAQAHNALVAAQDGEPAEPPDVEPPPFALAAVTGEHDVAPQHRAVAAASPYDVARLNDNALAELAGRVLDERNRRINAP
jgi:hypothetical protein